MSFLSSILLSSLLKNINISPIIVGISAGIHSPVLKSTASPIMMPVLPSKIISFPILCFGVFGL